LPTHPTGVALLLAPAVQLIWAVLEQMQPYLTFCSSGGPAITLRT
jgi:hypothetical protein